MVYLSSAGYAQDIRLEQRPIGVFNPLLQTLQRNKQLVYAKLSFRIPDTHRAVQDSPIWLHSGGNKQPVVALNDDAG